MISVLVIFGAYSIPKTASNECNEGELQNYRKKVKSQMVLIEIQFRIKFILPRMTPNRF